jgi:KipI family sensor histidine kinase inhibitor
MRVRPYGNRALLIEVDGSPLAWQRPVAMIAGIVEVVPAARTLLVRFDPRVTDRAAVQAALESTEALVEAPRPGQIVTIAVRYDGDDLSAVAELAGCSVIEVIARHTAAEYTVAFCGFAPGFGYLTGLDPRLHVARLDTPRTRVPAGSVAIAGEYSAVYPHPSPGGWRLLGRTELALWDVDRDPPALLSPGTHVRFEARS